jgi:hypothetical protein
MFRGLSLLAACVFLTATVVVALQAPVHPAHVTSADAVEFMPLDPRTPATSRCRRLRRSDRAKAVTFFTIIHGQAKQ